MSVAAIVPIFIMRGAPCTGWFACLSVGYAEAGAEGRSGICPQNLYKISSVLVRDSVTGPRQIASILYIVGPSLLRFVDCCDVCACERRLRTDHLRGETCRQL